jgi:hypothetical protein
VTPSKALQVIDLQGFSQNWVDSAKSLSGGGGICDRPRILKRILKISVNRPHKPADRRFSQPERRFRFRIKSRTNQQKTLASPGKAQHY